MEYDTFPVNWKNPFANGKGSCRGTCDNCPNRDDPACWIKNVVEYVVRLIARASPGYFSCRKSLERRNSDAERLSAAVTSMTMAELVAHRGNGSIAPRSEPTQRRAHRMEGKVVAHTFLVDEYGGQGRADQANGSHFGLGSKHHTQTSKTLLHTRATLRQRLRAIAAKCLRLRKPPRQQRRVKLNLDWHGPVHHRPLWPTIITEKGIFQNASMPAMSLAERL